jgi:hypothetical protein
MFASKIRIAIAVAAVAVTAMSFGASAAPADAALSLSPTLTITKNQPGYSTVQVTGLVKGTPAELQNVVSKDYRIVWRLWGDDTFSDDFIHGPDPASLQMTSQGLEFKGLAVMKTSKLNEDWGVDEIYAGVRLVTTTSYINGKITHGPTIVGKESNQIWRSF